MGVERVTPERIWRKFHIENMLPLRTGSKAVGRNLKWEGFEFAHSECVKTKEIIKAVLSD